MTFCLLFLIAILAQLISTTYLSLKFHLFCFTCPVRSLLNNNCKEIGFVFTSSLLSVFWSMKKCWKQNLLEKEAYMLTLTHTYIAHKETKNIEEVYISDQPDYFQLNIRKRCYDHL